MNILTRYGAGTGMSTCGASTNDVTGDDTPRTSAHSLSPSKQACTALTRLLLRDWMCADRMFVWKSQRPTDTPDPSNG